MSITRSKHGSKRLRDEWRLCLAFIRHPHLYRDLTRHVPAVGRMRDWLPSISLGRLVGWAASLWVLNIFALGPFVLAAFEASGATHRIDVNNLPWIQAIFWAPVVEELLFRYGLRKPLQSVWVMPAMALVLVFGLRGWASLLLTVSIAVLWLVSFFTVPPKAWAYKWLRLYRRGFPWVFHLVALAFAAVHLRNFVFEDVQWWVMLVLVTPQWLTGLVLGWIRVQKGVAASMLLHALFNVGPLMVAWLALKAGLE